MAKFKKQALGRGLDAILGEVREAYENNISDSEEMIVEIEVAKITPNPYQPRKTFKDTSLQELADSIRQYGILQPILVYQNDDEFVLIAGERRLRASKIAGLNKIRAIIAKIDLERLREVALIENIQREDLNPIDLAKAYRELLEVYHLTHDELAEKLQKSRAQISNTLRLLNLLPPIQEMLIEEKITQGHAKILVTLSKEEQKKIASSIIGQKLSVRESEKLVKTLKNKAENLESFKEDNLATIRDEIVKKLHKYHLQYLFRGKKLSLIFNDEHEMRKFLDLL